MSETGVDYGGRYYSVEDVTHMAEAGSESVAALLAAVPLKDRWEFVHNMDKLNEKHRDVCSELPDLEIVRYDDNVDVTQVSGGIFTETKQLYNGKIDKEDRSIWDKPVLIEFR
jgi:hypothetical protein